MNKQAIDFVLLLPPATFYYWWFFVLRNVGDDMRKIIVMTCAALLAMPVWGEQPAQPEQSDTSDVGTIEIVQVYNNHIGDDDIYPGWFITVGANVYTHTLLGIRFMDYRVSEDLSDTFNGYFIGMGRTWDWVTLGGYMNTFYLDDVRIRNITGRATMALFPLENMPHAIVEMGWVHINQDGIRKNASSMGWGLGIRMDVVDTIYIDICAIYNMSKIRFDISDVLFHINARHWNIGVGIGYIF